MPTPDIKPGSPCWIDLATSDTAKAREFYGELFGWQFEAGSQELYGGYITASKDGQPVAGIMAKQEDQAGIPDAWCTYLRTDDAAATAESVARHGGQTHMPPMDVPAQGVMAFFGDAGGADAGGRRHPSGARRRAADLGGRVPRLCAGGGDGGLRGRWNRGLEIGDDPGEIAGGAAFNGFEP